MVVENLVDLKTEVWWNLGNISHIGIRVCNTNKNKEGLLHYNELFTRLKNISEISAGSLTCILVPAAVGDLCNGATTSMSGLFGCFNEYANR